MIEEESHLGAKFWNHLSLQLDIYVSFKKYTKRQSFTHNYN